MMVSMLEDLKHVRHLKCADVYILLSHFVAEYTQHLFGELCL